jgi:hypothetical protein
MDTSSVTQDELEGRVPKKLKHKSMKRVYLRT